ncbi:hypothetical protein P9112_006562 [Eukaryota sp. TZLM1-RC]
MSSQQQRQPRTASQIRADLASQSKEHYEHKVVPIESQSTVCQPERQQQVCEPVRSVPRTRSQICRDIEVGRWTETESTGPCMEEERIVMEPVGREKVVRQPMERVCHSKEDISSSEVEQRREYSSSKKM